MAFSTGGRGPFSGQMNVTPLIDVLLVLIIMFMVVVSMSKQEGVDAQIPQPAPKNAPDVHDPERTIVIQVSWDAQTHAPALKINQESVAWETLGPRLERIYLGRAEKVAFVKGDDDLDFDYVAQVIAEAHNAGVERVGLLTKRSF
ncbi:MAG TPA: biopolymer transporter ExbD [Terriglobales bacterium]